MYFAVLLCSSAPLEIPTGPTDSVPLRTPTPPRPDDARLPSPPRTSPAAPPTAPRSGAGDAGLGSADIPASGQDTNLGASSSAPEIEKTTAPADSGRPSQPQQKPPQPQVTPQQQQQQRTPQQQQQPPPRPSPSKQQQQKQKEPASSVAGKPSPRDTVPDKTEKTAGKAAPSSAQKSTGTKTGPSTAKTTAGTAAPTVTEKTTASKPPPNPDRQIVLQERTSTSTAVSGATASAASWGFGPLKTLSGGSLGSLDHYHADWCAADLSEVSSKAPAGQIISEHPAGPSLVAQKLSAAKAALLAVDQAASVSCAE